MCSLYVSFNYQSNINSISTFATTLHLSSHPKNDADVCINEIKFHSRAKNFCLHSKCFDKENYDTIHYRRRLSTDFSLIFHKTEYKIILGNFPSWKFFLSMEKFSHFQTFLSVHLRYHKLEK